MEELSSLLREIEENVNVLERRDAEKINKYFEEQARKFESMARELKGGYKLIATTLSEYMSKVSSTFNPTLKKKYIREMLQFINEAQKTIDVAKSLDVDLSEELEFEKVGELHGEPVYSIRIMIRETQKKFKTR